MLNPKTGIVFPERHKNTQKTRRHQEASVHYQKSNCNNCTRCIIKFSHYSIQAESSFTQVPNLPSIAFLILSSYAACLFFDLLTLAGGLPRGGSLILIPLSLHHARFSRFTINPICMN